MRKAQVIFTVAHPGKRYRHEKPDLKALLEKRDESYVDVASATWQPIFLQSINEWTIPQSTPPIFQNLSDDLFPCFLSPCFPLSKQM